MEMLLEKLKKAMDDPEFFKKIEDKILKKQEIYNEDLNRIKHIFDDDNQFGLILNKLILKHNDKYKDKCYYKGYEPFPNNVLNLIIDFIMKNNDRIDAVRDCMFPTDTCYYKGFYFEIMYGQGSLLTIYDKDKNMLLTI